MDASNESLPTPKKGEIWESFRHERTEILDVTAIGITVKGTWSYKKTFSRKHFRELYPKKLADAPEPESETNG